MTDIMKHLFSKNHQVLHEEAGYLFSTITHQTENVLSKDIIENIIADGSLRIEFFKDVEEHIKVVQPVKETIIALEFRIMSLTDCFIQLTKFSMARYLNKINFSPLIETGKGLNLIFLDKYAIQQLVFGSR
ncbi:2336_t:CDS:2 [Entrophospora sp. SA101]|nr:2336_t:CDS:2 [Entrophospora sp. SA101]